MVLLPLLGPAWPPWLAVALAAGLATLQSRPRKLHLPSELPPFCRSPHVALRLKCPAACCSRHAALCMLKLPTAFSALSACAQVVDMFGAGLPAAALAYPAIGELVSPHTVAPLSPPLSCCASYTYTVCVAHSAASGSWRWHHARLGSLLPTLCPLPAFPLPPPPSASAQKRN